MKTVEVVRVVSTHPPSQGAFVEINAADFDPLVHELYRPADERPSEPAPDALKPKGRRVPKTPT